MTLQELKTRATASELTLIERVEALVAEASNTEQLRADAAQKIRDELHKVAEKAMANARESHLTQSELLGRAVHEYLKENP